MARSLVMSLKYEMLYKIEFTGPIRGHHIYKDTWSPVVGEQLHCKPDPREEALTYDKHALGLYKHVDSKDILVGHVPIELSGLLFYFLTTDSEKRKKLRAEVIGKRKREIGLVVPTKYTAMTNDRKFAEVLLQKLEEKKKIIDITISETNIVTFPCYDRK